MKYFDGDEKRYKEISLKEMLIDSIVGYSAWLLVIFILTGIWSVIFTFLKFVTTH